MKKIAYNPTPSGEESPEEGPGPEAVEGLGTTETGSRGFGLSEILEDFDATNPGESPNDRDVLDKTSVNNLLDILIVLGNELDASGEIYLADFADHLIKKFAQVKEVDYSQLFNSIILKVRSAGIANTNDTIKKLTKIYSRTMLLEYNRNQDLDKAKESAYKKTLHRAEQYLSEA